MSCPNCPPKTPPLLPPPPLPPNLSPSPAASSSSLSYLNSQERMQRRATLVIPGDSKLLQSKPHAEQRTLLVCQSCAIQERQMAIFQESDHVKMTLLPECVP